MVPPADPLTIAINRLEIVRDMASTIKLAETKDDIAYILQRMHDELEHGLDEIDQMQSAAH